MDNKQHVINEKAQQVARTTDDFLVKKYSKKQVQSFFGKLGSSLGIVVTVLPFAGLLLAIGGIVLSKANGNEAITTIGLILSNLGNAAYANLGLFFMLAIIMGFTGFKGMAVYSSLIGYIAFVGFQLPFIRYATTDVIKGQTVAHQWIVGGATDPFAVPKTFSIWFWHGLNSVTQLDNVLGLKQGTYIPQLVTSNPGGFARFSYQGIKTLNTGVLGGIALGFTYSWIFNHTKDMKLPNILSFFEGEKFTSVIMVITAPIVASLFIIIWPAVNYALGYIGIGLSYLPYGIDSLLYGFIFQCLLPFMAHMAFISPLWWTGAGGNIGDAATQQHIMEAMMYRIAMGHSAGIGQEANYVTNVVQEWANKIWVDPLKSGGANNLWDYLNGKGSPFQGDKYTDIINSIKDVITSAKGEGINENTKVAINNTLDAYNNVAWQGTTGDQLISVELLTKNPGFDIRDAWSANVKTTRFITGGFANDLFVLPAAAFGMWATLDGPRRKQKFGLYLGAILSSFIFGVSEPIIFMFAFACPLIYFLVYAPIFGILSWLSLFLQAKVGSTFSQGLMDYVINGIIPTVTKTNDGVGQTRLWIPPVIGFVAFFPAMFSFRWLFIKAEFAAPGSFAAEEGIGTSQSRYQGIKPSYEEFLEFVGGDKNIETMKLNSDGSATINVKKPEDVKTSNEYSKVNVKKIINDGNSFTFFFKPRNGVNMDYIKYVNDAVDLKNREQAYKLAIKAKKAEFKSDKKLAKTNNNQIISSDAMSKEDIRQFELLVKRIEKINKIQAEWQFRADKLEATTDIDMLKYNHTVNVWNMKHLEQKEILKANYRSGIKLLNAGYTLTDQSISNTNDAKLQMKQLKDSYNNHLKEVEVDTNSIKAENANFKVTLKQMEAAKKATFKKDEKE